MLNVKTPNEVIEIINTSFEKLSDKELVSLAEAAGRVLSEDVFANEYVPDFDRSTVDGYAVMAADTFGCSDSIPAILKVDGEIFMGGEAGPKLNKGECRVIPTGGAVPEGADSVVMLEYVEDYGDGTVGIAKPAAPGLNMVYRGDDVKPGKCVVPSGRVLAAQDIGALAAIGVSEVSVCRKPVVGIISTGDELVPIEKTPEPGQIRDVNSSMLHAFAISSGAEAIEYGIIRDEEELLGAALDKALKECDLVLISGGSSVGTKDASCRIIESRGEMLLHGIAAKPGKPTIMGNCNGKPVVGLPGHPGAACFISEIFVKALIARLQGRVIRKYPTRAILSETIGANHGRTQYTGVRLREDGDILYADPIHSKSGLISSLSGADAYFCIERDSEGVMVGDEIDVYLYNID